MTAALILIHILISFAALGAGAVILAGMIDGRRQDKWHEFFLGSTIATSLTGFILPATKILPSHIVGLISLVVLALAVYARFGKHLAGGWRRIYANSALTAFYFNVFVLVAQAFKQIPALHVLAPTQAEPPFAIAQLVTLALFVLAGRRAVRGFNGRRGDRPTAGRIQARL